MEQRTNPAAFRNPYSRASRLARLLWHVTWLLLFRPSPWFMGAWRTFLLRRFGARIRYARFHASVRVWAPWLLDVGDQVWVDERVYFYNPFGATVGSRVVISQGAFFCTASHDHTIPDYPLTGGRITVGDDCWVTADAFVGPGVTVAPGTVVAARAVVVRNTDPWTVVGGNPARTIKKREMRDPNNTSTPAATPAPAATPGVP